MPSPQFDLHKLGWKSFQDLVGTLLKGTMGQTVQVFSEGADGGRDGAYFGAWKPDGGELLLSGAFTVQCKHVGQPGKRLPKAVIAGELPKVRRLADKGMADVYLFFTNHSVPATAAAVVEKLLEDAGAGKAIVFDAGWINQHIAENPRLRRLVPRLYGLGDLAQIVTHQAYRQARATLDSVSADLACFVPTEAYNRCAHALQEHGFVILVGEPASGKTMIANLMALSAADEWNLQTLVFTSPKDLDTLWNPDDPGQFFWVDDAFGPNQLDYQAVQEWNKRLPKLKAAIKAGARVVFTSRTYIFRGAQHLLSTDKFELLNDSRVTIEVEKLTESEKAMMLYNHLKLGKQPKQFLSTVKDLLPDAVATEKFLPEIARRFSIPKFTHGMERSEKGVVNFFNNPTSVMEDVVKRLGHGERAAIALVFVNGGRLRIPLDTSDSSTLETITIMRSNVGDVKAALTSLDDSLLRKNMIGNTQYWQFRHPTIRDAFASIIGGDPEQIDIYISGATKDRILAEVCCGDMGVEGAKVIIPPTTFDRVLKTIAGDDRKGSLKDDGVASFLAKKCTNDFLRLYFEDPALIEMLPSRISTPYRFDSALTLLIRLNGAGALPNEVRLAAAERILGLAETMYWRGFVDGSLVGELFSEEENAQLLARQKDVVYSNQDEIINDVEGSWDESDDVDDALHDIKNLVERFIEENDFLYGEEGYVEEEPKKGAKFLEAIEDRARLMRQRQPETATYKALETENAVTTDLISARSIFDDIDD